MSEVKRNPEKMWVHFWMEENLVMDSMEKAAQWLFVSGETCSQKSAHTNAIWEAKLY